MSAPRLLVRVQAEPFDLSAEIARFGLDDGRSGAIASFSGLCRDEGGTLDALELEHFPAMADRQLAAVADRAASRFTLDGLILIHRYGVIRPGEVIVGVASASPHRRAALDAVSMIMDYLKTDAPFWKKEHRKDGSTGWVAAKSADDVARAQWDADDDN